MIIPVTNDVDRPPAESSLRGSLVYNTTDSSVQYCTGTAWMELAPSSGDNIYSTNGTLAGTRVVTMSGNDLTFDGTGDVIIKDNGNVGIGTTAPTNRLTVTGGNADFTDSVGIGITEPKGLMHISSGIANDDAVMIIEADTDNNDELSSPRLEFWQDGGHDVAMVGLNGDAIYSPTGLQNSNALILANSMIIYPGISFRCNLGSDWRTAPERMFINELGQIKFNDYIGTNFDNTSPAGYLAVDGSGNVVKNPATNIALTDDEPFRNVNDSSAATNSSTDIFYNSGNVGIGTTTPQGKLEVKGGQFGLPIEVQGNKTGATTIDWSQGNIQHITLTGNTTLTFSGGLSGRKYTLIIKQDATGGHTVTWPTDARFSGTTGTINVTATANKTDYIGFFYNAVDAKYDNLSYRDNY